MKKLIYTALLLSIFGIVSCEDDDVNPVPTEGSELEIPATYSFERNGESTVSFSGQTERILMSEELLTEMVDFDNATVASISDMFSNENNPFESSSLNTSSKNIKSKVAASEDYYANDASASAVVRAYFETQFAAQINEVFPAENTTATQGNAGQIADDTSTRYVNGKGFEYNQIVGKSLIGALMLDQALNNYLGTAVLDGASNRTDNTNGVLEVGENYTSMEHKWDEAFGYVYGTAPDPENAIATTGNDDNFLNKYIGRVEGDSDFAGISQDIFDAFKLGRAAIVAKDYDLRDEQVVVLRNKLSEIIGIRAVYYLQQGKNALEVGEFGTAFHDLSEGYGFIYSLQFTRNTDTNAPYFTSAEVNDILDTLTNGDGLWEITPATLDLLSSTIADRFDFSVQQAGS